MTQTEALKLALEALESTGENDGYHGVTQYFDETMVDQAITAIKAALLSRSDGEAQTRSVVKDEPVAFENWLSRTCPSGDAESVQRQWESSSDYADLYTTPPQRKPLTNQQIAKILEHGDVAESNDKVGWYVLPYSFARAIEAAHGIKGEA